MTTMLFTRHQSRISIKAIMELMLMCRGDLPTTVEHIASSQALVVHLLAGLEKRIVGQMEDVLAAELGILRRQITPRDDVNWEPAVVEVSQPPAVEVSQSQY